MKKRLVIPPGCVVVSPQPGIIFGFIGAEVFRKAIDRRGTTSTTPGNDTASDHEGDVVTNFNGSDHQK
jgi:hypothetical protein